LRSSSVSFSGKREINNIPAYVVLGFWFVMQLLYGLSSLGIPQGGGVAFWAHIGGFAAGMVLISLLPEKETEDDLKL